MRKAVAWALLLAAGLAPARGQDDAPKVISCFETQTSALRLAQVDRAIELCTLIIDDQAITSKARGEALSQRGLLHARRWTAVEIPQEASQGIADISEGLRLYTPPEERRHLLLIIRAQLYVATGQTRRASDDYRTVLNADPNNAVARAGLRRLGQPEGL
jgi:hypothetical protein